MRRWLADITPVDLETELRAHHGPVEPGEEHDLGQRIAAILRWWGEIAQSVGVSQRTFDVSASEATGASAIFFGGWLHAGHVCTTRPWDETLMLAPVWFPEDLSKCIEELAEEER
jgi:hypothetical protein